MSFRRQDARLTLREKVLMVYDAWYNSRRIPTIDLHESIDAQQHEQSSDSKATDFQLGVGDYLSVVSWSPQADDESAFTLKEWSQKDGLGPYEYLLRPCERHECSMCLDTACKRLLLYEEWSHSTRSNKNRAERFIRAWYNFLPPSDPVTDLSRSIYLAKNPLVRSKKGDFQPLCFVWPRLTDHGVSHTWAEMIKVYVFEAPHGVLLHFTDLSGRDIKISGGLLSTFEPRCSTRATLQERLKEDPDTMADFSNLKSRVVALLCELIFEDESRLLQAIEIRLQDKDRDLSDDAWVRRFINDQRGFLGGFRTYLHAMQTWNVQHVHNIGVASTIHKPAFESSATISRNVQDPDFEGLQQDFKRLKARILEVLEHTESTFTATIGTMSILESQKAIAEAESVTKLTQLAFFFIPLTFVAGIFGTNIYEIDKHPPKAWTLVITSIVFLLATYAVLYLPVYFKEYHQRLVERANENYREAVEEAERKRREELAKNESDV